MLTNEELLKRGWYAPALERTDIRVAEEGYSPEVIKGFLEGSLSGRLEEDVLGDTPHHPALHRLQRRPHL